MMLVPTTLREVAVGDEFNADMFIIKCDAEYVVVYPGECEVLED